jgi:hypothetical protein
VADAWVDGGIDGFSGLLCRRYVGTHVVGTDGGVFLTEEAKYGSVQLVDFVDGVEGPTGRGMVVDREAVVDHDRLELRDARIRQQCDRATHTEAEDAHVASLAAQSVDDGANIFQGDREAVLTGTRKVVNEVKSEQVLGPRVSSLGEC